MHTPAGWEGRPAEDTPAASPVSGQQLAAAQQAM